MTLSSYRTPRAVPLTDRQIANRIGREYLAIDADRDRAIRAFELVAAVNDVLFERMQQQITVEFVEDDPYPDYESMVEDIDLDAYLAVWTGGTHPDYYHGDPDLSRQKNLVNRAVHDYFGHYLNRVDFSFWGEFQKWHAMRDCYPSICHPFLFAEVVGQTAMTYYLPDGFDDARFEQRAVRAPESWEQMCYENCPVRLTR